VVPILLVLLLALMFFGLGFAVHLLWILAVILLAVWIIGWAFARGESSGSRRQWYGRW
jgi:small-conductance mechanosensitive channel